MAKKKKNPSGISLTFEEALGELEAIVQSLEEGKVGLEESLALYEKGAKLLKQGHELLADAEHRIEQVSGVDADGNPVLKSFPASSNDSENHADSRSSKAKASSKRAAREKNASNDSGLF